MRTPTRGHAVPADTACPHPLLRMMSLFTPTPGHVVPADTACPHPPPSRGRGRRRASTSLQRSSPANSKERSPQSAGAFPQTPRNPPIPEFASIRFGKLQGTLPSIRGSVPDITDTCLILIGRSHTADARWLAILAASDWTQGARIHKMWPGGDPMKDLPFGDTSGRRARSRGEDASFRDCGHEAMAVQMRLDRHCGGVIRSSEVRDGVGGVNPFGH
jgi:hypothetical protein